MSATKKETFVIALSIPPDYPPVLPSSVHWHTLTNDQYWQILFQSYTGSTPKSTPIRLGLNGVGDVRPFLCLALSDTFRDAFPCFNMTNETIVREFVGVSDLVLYRRLVSMSNEELLMTIKWLRKAYAANDRKLATELGVSDEDIARLDGYIDKLEASLEVDHEEVVKAIRPIRN